MDLLIFTVAAKEQADCRVQNVCLLSATAFLIVETIMIHYLV